jgi:hypothetical protein
MDKHAKLLKAARDAVDTLYSDTSVEKETTMESMEEVREHVQEAISTLREEIARDR